MVFTYICVCVCVCVVPFCFLFLRRRCLGNIQRQLRVQGGRCLKLYNEIFITFYFLFSCESGFYTNLLNMDEYHNETCNCSQAEIMSGKFQFWHFPVKLQLTCLVWCQVLVLVSCQVISCTVLLLLCARLSNCHTSRVDAYV